MEKDNRPIIILVLGILGLTGCQVLGPVAWVMGNQYRTECMIDDREPDQLAVVGRVLGMVGTGFLVLGLCLAGLVVLLDIFIFAMAQ
jgi:hypothetical protein